MASIDITDQDFEAKVLQSKIPVLVDFWAEWCVPCKMAGPVLEELSEAYKDKIQVVKLNVDQNQLTPGSHGIMSIPTTILFKDGKEIGRQVGFSGKEAFEELMKKGVTS
ncbi:thioredoxin [Candidatus Woesebacteria bacterium RIFOXYC1_FULL_41_14]|uniref:Thioredoxin n=3 Tax=Candidatus Woeseibacteriota TaxID=1752722 RepID=A0A0G0Z9P8_9BACT|nr:MAG: Thioredoxin [Candidatus Woesebacteria bacterium GW2011_GWD1_41_12]KKS18791.1 MAG: Thioredoxin [Candidatus Woesebacteria bacterium GW2011_GWA1_41_7]OGM80345.1 MAG: thioredoxin [Candidatus Woesebacteria bacterium RIFOXYB1_FULL_41_13]OGM85091.1 MAG: thioredoxin [Candidatus Woesebacteria bacterium RIFOXYC1_FULL_41_14]